MFAKRAVRASLATGGAVAEAGRRGSQARRAACTEFGCLHLTSLVRRSAAPKCRLGNRGSSSVSSRRSTSIAQRSRSTPARSDASTIPSWRRNSAHAPSGVSARYWAGPSPSPCQRAAAWRASSCKNGKRASAFRNQISGTVGQLADPAPTSSSARAMTRFTPSSSGDQSPSRKSFGRLPPSCSRARSNQRRIPYSL